ncbi:hypothetical protein CEXT_261641 [Caerostris extrusa]|uniref:Secreted protein n=1 Tax=Caerostris extrusa TaxID=172846 RepID=A0AAV4RUQ4_CAEEX|nr:hypothetical protein CEXT_261641 [Caerostris extrusa]
MFKWSAPVTFTVYVLHSLTVSRQVDYEKHPIKGISRHADDWQFDAKREEREKERESSAPYGVGDQTEGQHFFAGRS